MRSKEAFLNALQQGIAVLAESEQKDILAEYAQHIELKMSGGLTEEEAVQDFGDVQQLIAEILEAYHVNPAYASGDHEQPNACASMGQRLTDLGRWIQSGIRERAKFKQFCAQMPEGTMSTEEHSQGPCRGDQSSRTFRKVRRTAVRGLKFGGWFVWNAAVLLCAIPVALTGMISLLLLGVVVVWLSQGMPLVGAFLFCVGALAACVGILGLGKNAIWHRHRTVREGTERIAAGEDQTEKEVLDHVE